MKIAILGAAGQLGRAMRCHAESQEIVALTSSDLDIRDRAAVRVALASAMPDVVVNAAAYTAVDRAESEPEVAMAVNGDGVKNIAEATTEIGAKLVQVSTDFVFGDGHRSPILPEEKPRPISVYGRSKLVGEEYVASCMDADSYLILRTSWLYSEGSSNFLSTMLRLMQERSEIGVVADQIGSPTSVDTLSAAIYGLLARNASGVHHLTDAGIASWYDFAVAIRDLAVEFNLLADPGVVRPISTSEYPTPARRPKYSVLDKGSVVSLLGHDLPHWRHSLSECVRSVASRNV